MKNLFCITCIIIKFIDLRIILIILEICIYFWFCLQSLTSLFSVLVFILTCRWLYVLIVHNLHFKRSASWGAFRRKNLFRHQYRILKVFFFQLLSVLRLRRRNLKVFSNLKPAGYFLSFIIFHFSLSSWNADKVFTESKNLIRLDFISWLVLIWLQWICSNIWFLFSFII